MIPTSVRIFVCTERQDMRRSFDAQSHVPMPRVQWTIASSIER